MSNYYLKGKFSDGIKSSDDAIIQVDTITEYEVDGQKVVTANYLIYLNVSDQSPYETFSCNLDGSESLTQEERIILAINTVQNLIAPDMEVINGYSS